MITTNAPHFRIGSTIAVRSLRRWPANIQRTQVRTRTSYEPNEMEIQHWLSGGYSVMKEMSDA